jgi:DNA-binding transcriptional regulator YiaG
MTGKVLDNGSAGILILILPLAFGFVLLYKLWPIFLALTILILAFRIWDNYQWKKWCEKVNPYFNQLIKENQGYLTPIDLSVKANLSARSAKAFLSRKSEEYGVPPKKVKDKGLVYYFPTASALGSIFDDSDIEDDSDYEPAVDSYQLAAKDSSKLSVKGIAQLAKQEQSQKASEVATESSAVAQLTKTDFEEAEAEEAEEAEVNQEISSINGNNALIQAELAKRLDCNSSTVGRRKSNPDFSEWSQSKDPEGIAWKYLPETQLYVPVDSD